MIRFVLCMAAVLFGSAGWLSGQPAGGSGAQISFKFERPVPGIPVPRYTIQIRDDGTGSYTAQLAGAANAEDRPLERKLLFRPATSDTVFEALRLMRSSRAPCAAQIKNIADTGNKTIEYRNAEGEGTCSYNYSENKGVVQLTDFFFGVETTLEAGRALEMKHRFDRLGLDAEMISLMASVDSGRAVALEVIGPTLRSIAADTELIERVRLRAAKLLERAGDAPQASR